MMNMYGGIDLHANNSVIVLIDEQEQVVFQTRTPNDVSQILFHLHPFQPGPLSKPPISRCGTIRRCSASISARNPKRKAWSPSRRSPIS